MVYFLCDRLTGDPYGDGESINYPAIVGLTTEPWSVTCEGGARMLVRTAHVPAFDGVAAIRPLRRALLASIGATDDGETDDADAPDLARKVARRLLLRQYLGADDFGLSLTDRIGDLSAAQRLRIRNKLAAYRKPIDISALTADSLVGDALALILPQLDVRLDPRPVRPSGTFIDSFNNTGGANVNLESWTATPSGGVWTRVDGAAGKAYVSNSVQRLANFITGAATLYQCADQGSANQYIQFAAVAAGTAYGGANRADAAENFVGIRFNADQVQLSKFIAGAFTALGAAAAVTTDVLRLESSGDSHDVYIDGSPAFATVTESHNNTVTRQGISARGTTATYSMADDFEAGVLAGGGGGGAAPVHLLLKTFQGGFSNA